MYNMKLTRRTPNMKDSNFGQHIITYNFKINYLKLEYFELFTVPWSKLILLGCITLAIGSLILAVAELILNAE